MIEYTYNDWDFRAEYKDLYMWVANTNGVFLGERSIITIIDDEYETLVTREYASEVYRIQGVNIDGDGVPISGFQLSLIVIIPLITLTFRKKRGKNE